MRLPRSLDDLHGLRAARWIRESTRGQFDRFGPDAQRRLQDELIEQCGLIDTGIVWTVAHSGRTIARSREWAEMLAAAGTDYDVLLLGYVNRLSRSVEAFIDAKRHLHGRGAVLLFCSEQVLTSDEERWERWAREMVEAEAYSRRLGGYIRDGYRAKFETEGDQGGSPPLGLRRVGEHRVLAVDPASIGRVVRAFERYAMGTVSINDLAGELDIAPDALRMMLRNPIYNGWVRRHRRSRDEERRPAAWRHAPPVSDELWSTVQAVLARRHTGGGHPTPVHDHLLNGVLYCDCGRRIRAEMHVGGRRYRHHERCAAWSTATVVAARFDEPIAEQVRRTRPGPHWLAQLRAMATVKGPRPDLLRRRQLERELADRALAHAQRRIATPAYLAEHARLTGQIEELSERPAEPLIDPDAAVRWLSDLHNAWQEAGMAARHKVIAALYDRIVVRSDGFVEVELTSTAYAHGVAAVMPPRVVLARPAGAGPGRNTVSIPIVARREWVRALRRSA